MLSALLQAVLNHQRLAAETARRSTLSLVRASLLAYLAYLVQIRLEILPGRPH